MSANIPFEIQEKIIKKNLSVKSLLQFRSVSKQWKSLIDSSEFITYHTQSHPEHLLIRYIPGGSDRVKYEDNYVSIVDDDSFPDHKYPPFVPPTVKFLAFPFMIDCSHGLVCLHGVIRDQENVKKLVVLWNPLVRKSVGIAIPGGAHEVVISFGVCPKTSDPKIVKITRCCSIDNEATAEVFTLSSGAWRSLPMNKPFKSKSLQFLDTQVVINGVIYWLTYDHIIDKLRVYSFDLTSEEFGEPVDFANNLGTRHLRLYNISKINESLVVLSYHVANNLTPKPFCDVWMMLKNGVPKPSFRKLFTVNDVQVDSIIGFRKNGQPIIVQTHRRNDELEVFEPCWEHNNGLGIYGSTFKMTSYTESLLLLNRSDSFIQ
ncbi:putative F-box domain-containing protein [Helianthus anomalus]